MNPAVEQVVSYAGGKVVDAILAQFKDRVIDRWSRYRAAQFFATFAEELRAGVKTEEEVARDLNSILADKEKSEAMFEAYRRVCLSRSKTIGPRCIALLTSERLTSTGNASGDHEAWFDLFETGSDADLGAIAAYLGESFENARKGHVDYQIRHSEFHHKWSHDYASEGKEFDSSPLNLYEYVGPWAARLERCGLMRTALTEAVKRPRFGDDGTHVVSYWVVYKTSLEKLGQLIDRAMKLRSLDVE